MAVPKDEVGRLELLFAGHPDSRIFLRLAEAYHAGGQYERARAVLEHGLQRYPEDLHAQQLLEAVVRARAEQSEPAGAGPETGSSDLEFEEFQQWVSDLKASGPRRGRAGRGNSGEGEVVASSRRQVWTQAPAQKAAVPGSEPARPAQERTASAKAGGVVTETMGDLYAQQGLYKYAVAVYRDLLRWHRPGDLRLEEKLATCENRLREQALRPPTWMVDETSDQVGAAQAGAAAAAEPEPERAEPAPTAFFAEPAAAGPAHAEPTAAEYLANLLDWRPAGGGTRAGVSEAEARRQPFVGTDSAWPGPVVAAERAAAGAVPAGEAVSARGPAAGYAPHGAVTGPADAAALVGVMVGLMEYRHPLFRGGSSLARLVALAIGRELALDEAQLEALELAALLRDLGRLALGGNLIVPAQAELEPSAKRRVEAHVGVGLDLLDDVSLPAGVRDAILHHHEHFDGGGYPDGLAGEAIPLLARIVAVADSFAALLAPRPYRPPRRLPAVLDELRKEAGRQYDPVVVEALIRALAGRERERFAFGLRHHLLVMHPEKNRATITAAKLCQHGYLAEVADGFEAAKTRLARVPVQALVLATAPRVHETVVGFVAELRGDRRYSSLAVLVGGADSGWQRIGLLEAGASVCLPSDAGFDELCGTIGALVGRAARSRPQPSGVGGRAAEPWYALQGDVANFPLAWLLQVLQYDARTVAVAVSAPAEEGVIYLERGELRHARTGRLSGEEALRAMLGWAKARFRVQPDVQSPERTITTQLMHLLLEEAVAEDHAGIFGAAQGE